MHHRKKEKKKERKKERVVHIRRMFYLWMQADPKKLPCMQVLKTTDREKYTPETKWKPDRHQKNIFLSPLDDKILD
jgi:hypothetical protein